MAASQFDLTTVAACKMWANATSGNTTDDTQLQLLITAVSRQIIREVGYSPFIRVQNEVHDGNGGQRIFIRGGPMIILNSLTVQEGSWGVNVSQGLPMQPVVIPPSGGSNWGYVFNTKSVTLVGYRFPIGKSNVTINFIAGESDTIFEQVTLPGTSYSVVNAAKFVADLGVTYANGVALTKVNANPTVGQYTVNSGFVQGPNIIGAGAYGFNGGDVGSNIYINYRFGVIPEDWQQIAIEAVGLLYAAKKHIGLDSQSLAGQHYKYIETGLPPETLRRLSILSTRVPVV